MSILAIDTSSDTCAVALLDGDSFIVRSETAARKHAQLVLPMVDSVLKEAGVSLSDIDAVAFGCGPGSFTGLRIAAGVAQGLAYGASLPVVSISNLEALSYAVLLSNSGLDACVSLLDARMDEVYVGAYVRQESGIKAIDAEKVMAPEAFDYPSLPDNSPEELASNTKTLAVIGSGLVYEDRLSLPESVQCISEVDLDFSVIQSIALLAQAKFELGEVVAAHEAAPVYVRDNVTWKKLPGRE